LTVIVPERAGAAAAAWKSERVESDTAVGARVQRGGRTTLVGFRKAGQGKAVLEGAAFDAPVSVTTR
jgi:hypothetical protein